MKRWARIGLVGIGLLVPGVAVALSADAKAVVDPSVLMLAQEDPETVVRVMVSFRELVPAESAVPDNKLIRVDQFFHAFRASDGSTWVGGYLLGKDEAIADALHSYLEAERYLVAAGIADYESALESATGWQVTDLDSQLQDLRRRLGELESIGVRVYAIQVTGSAQAVAALGASNVGIASINRVTGVASLPGLPWEEK